jgi:hypothetical protein
MLHISDVQMLPVEGGEPAHYHEKAKIKLYAAIGGYSVLDKILVTGRQITKSYSGDPVRKP